MTSQSTLQDRPEPAPGRPPDWPSALIAPGERTSEVARKHGLTAGRVSQLRRDFLEDWYRFCGEPRDNTPGA